jgi:UDP-N-acetylglucosamine 3-dehydrogenase
MSTNTTSAQPLRVGIIGCGDVARRVHLPSLEAAGAQVTRFASKVLADAEATANAAQGEAMATDDWRQLVASPHIDAVDVCTPNHLHAEMAIAALETGKHVLVESPMAITLRDADALLKTAARKGVMLIPAHSVRFIGPYAAMVDACRSGKIGTITGARIEFGHQGPDHLNPAATWYLERARSGGGALTDLGIAQVDLLRLATESEVTSVSARLSGLRGDVEERADVELTFASGATATIVASWTGAANLMTVTGTEGSLQLDKNGPRIVRPDGTEERLRPPEQHIAGVEAVFVDAASGDGYPTLNAADGRAAVAVVTAAYESAASGAPAEVTRPTW